MHSAFAADLRQGGFSAYLFCFNTPTAEGVGEFTPTRRGFVSLQLPLNSAETVVQFLF